MQIYSPEILNKYMDPPNLKEIQEELKSIQDHSDIRKTIERVFPDWLAHTTDHYSKDYPHFQKNWETMCRVGKLTKQSLVLVEFLDFNKPNHRLVMDFAEKMTKSGYCVRRLGEFNGCDKCGAAIPVERLWVHLKKLKFPIPDEWSTHCVECV